MQTAWPTDDPPLSRAERRDLQVRLASMGYDVGEPDGKVGQKTRDAIKDIERKLGMPATWRDPVKAKTMQQRLDDLHTALPKLYEHWEEALELNA